MAYQTGTATNYRDLLDKLRLFLTTDASLVAAGQAWQQLRWNTTSTTQELILKGVGLAGTDAIYCGISSDENTANDWFNWHINGYTGYDSLQTFLAQPGAFGTNIGQTGNGGTLCLNLWNSTIPYWFVANGRRFYALVNVSGRYQFMHVGLLTPYSTPAQTPYPLCLVANNDQINTTRWSGATAYYARYNAILNGASWLKNQVQLPALNTTYMTVASEGSVFPLLPIYFSGSAALVNGKYSMNYFGELDGVFVCPGVGVNTEDIINDGTYDHIVFQKNDDAGLGNFWAMRLN